MDWVEFVSKLVWPAVAITALVIFRDPIARKIEELLRVQFGKDKAVSFREILERVKSTNEEVFAAIEQESHVDLSLDSGTTSESASTVGVEEQTASRAFQDPMDEQYITRLSEKHPDLLVDQSWRIIEAELERLSEIYHVQNTRDSRAFWGIYHQLDSRIKMMAWILRIGAQIVQLRIAARQAVPDITAEQAREYAREALHTAKILSQFEFLVKKGLLE